MVKQAGVKKHVNSLKSWMLSWDIGQLPSLLFCCTLGAPARAHLLQLNLTTVLQREKPTVRVKLAKLFKCTMYTTDMLYTLCMQIVKQCIYIPFVDGADIPATAPLDTALDSGNPCGSRDVGNGHASSEPASDESQ